MFKWSKRDKNKSKKGHIRIGGARGSVSICLKVWKNKESVFSFYKWAEIKVFDAWCHIVQSPFATLVMFLSQSHVVWGEEPMLPAYSAQMDHGSVVCNLNRFSDAWFTPFHHFQFVHCVVNAKRKQLWSRKPLPCSFVVKK